MILERALDVAVRRAGAPGRIRFTERQLYYELCRVLLPLPLRVTRPVPLSYARFSAHGGNVEVVGPRRPAGPPPDEVFHYGVPRVLICQDRAIADMLLANGLHMESACAVYTVADLPLDPRLMVDRIYVLHDASLAGFAALADVRRRAGGVPVTPLGLRPAHARSMRLFRTSASIVDADLTGLEPWEQRWLRAGRSVEVAAVNPARLLRAVHRLVRDQARPRRPLPRLRELEAVGFLSSPTEGRT